MPRQKFQTVDEYIAMQPPAHGARLDQVRRALAKPLRGAEEAISYNIPAFRMHGRVVLYFAGFLDHYSIYPASDALIEEIPELQTYRASKGTLRFDYDKPVPTALITKIAKARVREVEARISRRA